MTETVFEVTVPYWPARVAMYWWERPATDVRAELEAAGAVGIRQLALDLLWDEFQPNLAHIAAGPMRQLERVLEVAHDLRLGIRLTLFPVRIGPLLWLPGWALQAGTQGPRQVMSGHHLSSMLPYNHFADPAVVEAQQRMVREVVSAFADHPAVTGWMLGRGLTSASSVPGPEPFARWIDSLAATARRAGATQRLWHGVDALALITEGGLAPERVNDAGIALEVADDRRPAWASLPRAAWSGYLAAYARAVSGAPVSIGGLGGCTVRADVRSPGCQDGAEVADQIAAAVESVHVAGGGGVTARALYDYSDELGNSPPFRQDPGLLTEGLLTVDSIPKETLAPWAAWSNRREAVRPALDLPTLDPEERHRDPQGVAREFYEVYTR